VVKFVMKVFGFHFFGELKSLLNSQRVSSRGELDERVEVNLIAG
jgi:hypothetical protein